MTAVTSERRKEQRPRKEDDDRGKTSEPEGRQRGAPRKEASCAVGPSGESQGGRVGLLLCSSCSPYSEFPVVMRESRKGAMLDTVTVIKLSEQQTLKGQ